MKIRGNNLPRPVNTVTGAIEAVQEVGEMERSVRATREAATERRRAASAEATARQHQSPRFALSRLRELHALEPKLEETGNEWEPRELALLLGLMLAPPELVDELARDLDEDRDDG
jgi:hypothetical protein